MKYNKGFAPVLIAIIIAGALVIGGGAYYWGKSSKINDKENLDNKENLIQEVKTNSTSNNLSFYKNDNLSFYYPNNWKIETLGTKNDKNIQIILDPIKVFSSEEIKGLDVSMGMITFSINNDSTEKNSFTIGYESFPTVTIGTNKIKAKVFEKFYSNDAPEVSAQGEHHITYYIGENIEINYRSEKDTYLKDFNQLINSLELNNSSKESSEKQIGYIKSIYSKDNTNYLTIDYVQWTHCDTDDCVASIKVINDNPLIRTFPISKDVQVKLVTYPDASGNYSLNQNLSLSKFKEALDYSLNHTFNPNHPPEVYYPKTILYWITIENGIITEIAEQFQA